MGTVAVNRLAAVDAQTYWMSAAIPNDQFLLYAFGAGSTGVDRALHEIRGRARTCPELRLRIADTGFWTYPGWVPCEVRPEQFVVHEPADRTWAACLAVVAKLVDDQLDPQVMTWRLHVFPAIEAVPGTRRGTVAVVQVSHALADGVRSSELAAHLFGRAGAVPAVAVARHSAAGFRATCVLGGARPSQVGSRHCHGIGSSPGTFGTTVAHQLETLWASSCPDRDLRA